MAQLEQAAGGSDEPIIAAEPTLEDRFAAISDEPQEQDEPKEPQAAQAAEEAPEDVPDLEIDDLEAEEAEDGELSSIQPPVSWTAEEKEEFNQLPRNLQETVTRRESERDKGLQTKMQETRQATVKVEQQALELLQQTRTDYTQSLQMLLPDVPEKPSYQLQAQNPHAFAAAMDAHEEAILVRNYIAQELDKVGQTQKAQQESVEARLAQLNHELLQEQFPEYLDPEKGPELRDTLRSTAQALGYSDDQLAQSDAHDVLAMKKVSDWKAKAEKYDTLMARQMERVRDGKNPPKITKPGTSQGKGNVQNQRYTNDRQAMRGGDRQATARVFSRFLDQ